MAAPAGGARDQGALPAAIDDEDKRLDGLLPLGASPLAKRGRGRPKNAKNRRTDLVAEYLIDRFGDPLTATASMTALPLKEFIVEMRKIASDVGMKLGATVMDCARFQRDLRNDVLPYLHAKRAPETAKGDPVVPIIGIGRADQVVIAGGMSLEAALAQREQNQQLIDHEPDMSHDEMSHDDE